MRGVVWQRARRGTGTEFNQAVSDRTENGGWADAGSCAEGPMGRGVRRRGSERRRGRRAWRAKTSLAEGRPQWVRRIKFGARPPRGVHPW